MGIDNGHKSIALRRDEKKLGSTLSLLMFLILKVVGYMTQSYPQKCEEINFRSRGRWVL